MTVYGVDISGWQRGIDLDQVAGEGFSAVIAKATEGSTYTSPAYHEQKAGAQRNNLAFMAYHYVTTTPAAAQVDNYEHAEPDRGVPVMLDHENGSGQIEVLRGVHAEFVRRGYHVALLYLPRWYWDGIGRPDLSGLPPLMASSYGSDQTGYASALYPGPSASGWNPYGGNRVAVLQFTQRARVAGLQIDAWAFRGTTAELTALFSADKEHPMSDAEDVAVQLMGPDRAGWTELLGKAVETAPDRGRYLVEAVAVILDQLCGSPNFDGWPQLGDGADSDNPRRTLVDGIAHVMRQNERILELLEAKS
ncbi:glycoside hydrolase family 25 protein [Nocardia brasiliensis]|uniref:glycoside hydrolase family 25 protein n=1 Tax=Nocardia brasiliensis TaxID=37326 RepID=UPI00069070A4|nr:glycoside hydrolase family 25 protein [Nocardia brasiliensis]